VDLKEEFAAAIEKMTEDDMPNADMRDVAHACGNDVAITLMRSLKGAYLCIPSQHPFGRVAEKFVIDKFDGTNAKALAFITGFSLRHVYEIVQREDSDRVERQEKIVQGNLFNSTQRVAVNG
jgi:hypothetical protein